MKDEIIEIENFFPKYVHRLIIQFIKEKNILWNYRTNISTDNENLLKFWTKNYQIQDSYGFSHTFDLTDVKYDKIINYMKSSIKSHTKLEVKKFIRIMLVILPPNPTYKDDHRMMPHIDMPNQKYTNFLYYINDNDAPTVFYNKKYEKDKDIDLKSFKEHYTITPKQNKAVLWDGSIYHSSSVSKIDRRLTLAAAFT